MIQSTTFKTILAAFIVVLFLYNSPVVIATVDYSFQGCFGGSKSKITLYNENSSTGASLETDGKILKRVTLDSLKLAAFHLFIRELEKLKEGGGCTTVYYYSACTQYKTVTKSNSNCERNAFENLQESLFGNSAPLVAH